MTVNARTDSESGLRFYTWQGREYPSVTSVRRLIGMPFSLHAWTLSKVVERAVTEYATLGEMLNRPARPRERARETNAVTEAKRWLRAAATEERDAAGDRGTRAHDAIERGLTVDQADADVRGHVAQFHDFLRMTGAEVVLSERQVFNLEHGYAGTVDAIVRIPHPVGPLPAGTYLCDWKTSKSVYLDHAIQVMAYSMADFVGQDDVVDDEATAVLHSAEYMAILHLNEDSWEFLTIEPRKDLLGAFLASLKFATFLYRFDNRVESLVSHTVTGRA